MWHGHHLSSAVSLEGASRESIQPGWGSSFVFSTGNNASDNTTFSVEVADFAEQRRVFPPGKRFTVHGTVSVSWAPFGLNWNVPVRGTTFYPVWEFIGE